MQFLNKVKKKLKSGTWYPLYNSFYENVRLDQKMILLESRSGQALESNILALLKELQKEAYSTFRVILSVKKNVEEDIRNKVQKYGLRVDRYVRTGSLEYYYLLGKAGFLVNDTSFPGRFVKKKGQIYLNTWHGTPLKKMGRDNMAEKVSMGNVMRNLLSADYLVFPNQFMEEKMSDAYMLPYLYKGTILHEGYPRNDVFKSQTNVENLKSEQGFSGKKLFAYLPTFRGEFDHLQEMQDFHILKDFLKCLDEGMKKDEFLLVKLHPFMKETVSFDDYTHIQEFPKQWDTYEGLNACDALITDYSSVFYDYANTGRKVILYAYDREEYMQTRGMYEDIRDYPFFYAEEKEKVLRFLHESGGEPTVDFLHRYATYEDGCGAEKICRHVFLKEVCCRTERFSRDKKENILIYGGDLNKNGVTTALCCMLEALDLDKYRYFVSFRTNSVKDHAESLERLPEKTFLYPMASEMNMDVLTAIALMGKMTFGWDFAWIRKRIERAYRREWKKHFGDSEFRHVIHYNGYEAYVTRLLQEADCKRTIWVHSDMVQELKVRKNHNYHILKEAYQKYDHVVTVSSDMVESARAIGGKGANIKVIENCHDYLGVRNRAEEEICFDAETESNVSLERLKEILSEKGDKFINIGRFSPEKGHKRLIEAFERYWENHRESYLIIIGGLGELYEETLTFAREKSSSKHIILIRSMRNPLPVLKRCDLFLLSSFYEGLGLVLLEADALGVPVMACDVKGPRGFLKKYGGILLDDSADGIYQGMELYARENICPLNVNYEETNKISVSQIEMLLDGSIQ